MANAPRAQGFLGSGMSEPVKAFAPGNISGVFKVIPDDDPARMHSLGLGLTIAEGVNVEVKHDDAGNSVFFNGEPVEFPTVASVVERISLGPVRVTIESPLPLSCGFGLSGASSLATAFGLNALMGLGRSQEDLAMVAHVSEVENLTGLGDVCAQFHGGCLVKLTPGEPLGAQRLAVEEQPIYYRYFGPISTRAVLSDEEARKRINGAADSALRVLDQLNNQDEVDLNACIEVCRVFAADSDLLRDQAVRGTIEEIEASGGSASMIMLGNAVFSTRGFAGASQTTLSMGKARLL